MRKNVVKFAKEKESANQSGVLFSIVYLWLEVKKLNMPETCASIESSIDAFFDDLESAQKMNSDYVQLRALLKRMLALGPSEVMTFLNYMAKSNDGQNI